MDLTPLLTRHRVVQRDKDTGPYLHGFHIWSDDVILCAKPNTEVGDQANTAPCLLLTAALLQSLLNNPVGKGVGSGWVMDIAGRFSSVFI